MRTFLFVFMALISFVQVNAQNSVLQSFYEQHKDVENVTSFNIGGNFLQNMTLGDDNEGKIRSTLKQLYVLNLPFSEVSASDLSNLKRDIKKNDYEELMTFREGKERVVIYIKEKKDHIEELLVMVEDSTEELLLVSLTGTILFEDLEHINIDGRAGEVIREIKH